MTLFLAGVFGGLGLGTVLGFLVGAWAQRRLKIETVVAVEAKKARDSIEKILAADEATEPTEPRGLGYPSGAVPPTHEEARSGKKTRIFESLRKMGMVK